MVLIPTILSFGLAVDSSYLPGLLALDGVVCFIAIIDAIRCWNRHRSMRVTIEAPTIWSRGRLETVTIIIDYLGKQKRTIDIALDVPGGFDYATDESQLKKMSDRPLIMTIDLEPRARSETKIKCVARERGGFHLGGLHVSFLSPMKFWQRHVLIGARPR